MTLPLSGAISQLEVNSEFGAPFSTPLTAMVRNGAYVPTGIGPNASIPAAPPIGLTDFYGTQRNPPGILSNFVVGQSSDANMPTMKILSMSSSGLYVPPYDGVNLEPSQFVVDLRVRLMPGAVDGTSAASGIGGGVTVIAQHRMNLLVGLTETNPAGASNAALAEGIVGARRIEFFKTTGSIAVSINEDHYFARAARYPGVSTGQPYVAGPQFSTLILPTTSNYAHIRIRRGVADVGGKLRWDVLFYYNNFLTFWGQVVDDFSNSADLANAGGYLFLANGSLNSYRGGSGELSVNRAQFVVGTATPTW
jgi:hypothetical protein